jgi:hypothetical protein
MGSKSKDKHDLVYGTVININDVATVYHYDYGYAT